MKTYVGIDVSKESLDTCVLSEQGKPRYRKFCNSPSGFRDLQAWVGKSVLVEDCHFCMESTGCYSFGIASWLADKKLVVSVENPRRIKHFAIAANFKTKTDKVDSLCIARYAQALNPNEWTLKDPIKREIAATRKRIRQINQDRLAEGLRLEDPYISEFSKTQIRGHIDFLSKQLNEAQAHVCDLMEQCEEARIVYKAVTGFNGLGPECGLLFSTIEIETYQDGKAASTQFGLNPRLHQSGKFCGQTKISKQGDAVGRSTLMSAANAAVKSNPVLRDFYDALIKRGLKRKQAIAAVARKIVVMAWAIARNALRGLPVTYPGGEHRGKNLRIYCKTS